MRRPTAAQIEAARRLFALEAQQAATAEDCAAVAGRVHEKLDSGLASLVGAAGASALFARSLKLTAVEFPCLANVDVDAEATGDGGPLARGLRGQAPAVATDATVALCATLLSLLETLIGERLTANILRSAWPTFRRNEETK